MITAAKVALSGTAYGFDAEYTYRCPEILKSSLCEGMRVLVPFGRGNSKRVGLVMRVYEREDESGIKPILSLIDRSPLIGDELMGLVRWLKEHTFCTFFEAFRTIVPSGYSVSVGESYSLSAQRPQRGDELDLLESELYSRLLEAPDEKHFERIVSEASPELLSSLADKGLLERGDEIRRRVGDETVSMVRLSGEYLSGELNANLTPKQRLVEQFLSENTAASVKEVIYFVGVTRTIISSMVKKGVLEEYKYETFRTPEISSLRGGKASEVILSAEQESAYRGILSLIDAKKPAGALLHGVTGSGKTAVFIKLIEAVTERGRSALMLVPEISLTPQLVGRFKAAFGDSVAVIHSALSLGQRMDEFKRARSGAAKIVIGTRSAVFAPLSDIGIIIMDEEGESSYKSESSPRYHARDVAIARCGTHSCVLLMASATPSLESYYYAKSGRYSLFELKKRYNEAPLPQVVVADMMTEAENGNETPFCEDLIRAVNESVKNGEQAILLLNRRGYNTFAVCGSCRGAIKCPNCLLPLTYHKQNGRLMCHVCGYSSAFDGRCPVCGGDNVRTSGAGTQLIEEQLSELFPDARILRMDADTTSSRIQYEEKFRDFEQGKYDIMIGTQMIAKGLDFPKVTVVGVISLDSSLFAGSYKSFERTFSLLTQVVGRGGRGSRRGLAYIQTYLPDHHIIELASRQDYKEFYEQEISLRRELIYPPFCDICAITFSSSLESDAVRSANAFVGLMREKLGEVGKFPLRVLGPAKSGQGRANRRYRYALTVKCKNNSAFRAFLSELLIAASKDRAFANVRIAADFNPENL